MACVEVPCIEMFSKTRILLDHVHHIKAGWPLIDMWEQQIPANSQLKNFESNLISIQLHLATIKMCHLG